MKNVEELERLYLEIANGNQEAYSFINSFNLLCHAVDDVIDGKITNKEDIMATFFSTVAICNHPYFVNNRNDLLPILVLLMNDYTDSLNDKDMLRDTLRFSGNYMLKIVAYKQGGYTLARKISTRLNNHSFKEHHNDETLTPE